MKPLEPIPIPKETLWREFRIKFLPVIVFVVVLAVTFVMWRDHVQQATLQGVGEGVRAQVSAAQPARVQQWLVEPHTVVLAGTPIVIIQPEDTRSNFDLLRSLQDLARAQSQPSLAEDNAMNFERIRVEVLRTRAELAIARVKLQQAERDVARNTPLYREKLVSEDIYELNVSTRDALKAEVEEKGRALAQMEQRLEQLRPLGDPDVARPSAAPASLMTQLENAHRDAARNLEPITLVAPITGMMGLPVRQAGEFVIAGDPLVMIDSQRSERIVAYLRQPYPVDPERGMAVQVTTRTRKRLTFPSEVLQIGAQLEMLTNSIAFLRPGTFMDAGLPIILSVPDDVDIRPGEVVDVRVTESAAPSGPVPAVTSKL